MKSFNGKQSVKDEYVARVRAHQEADEIVQGKYWEGGKGYAVGCTIEGSDHMKYEKEIGIPVEIAYIEDVIFEELSNQDAKTFPLQFLEAVQVGSDLSNVVAHLVIWQFEDEKYGLKNIKEVQDNKETYGLCEEVVALYRRSLTEEVPSKEYEDLYFKIDGARARAWAWTWAWAWAGAWAWAWAWAGARAWAGAWAGAGAWAWARARAWAEKDERARAMRDEFLRLIREAPIK